MVPQESHDLMDVLKEGGLDKWRLIVQYGITANERIIEQADFVCYLYGSLEDAKNAARSLVGVLCRLPEGHQRKAYILISRHVEHPKGMEAFRNYFTIPWTETDGWKSEWTIAYDSNKETFEECAYQALPAKED